MNDQNADARLDALFAQARARRPNTATAEYAFETRLLARLREARSTDSIWAMVTWRMAPFFAVCVIGLAVWQSEAASEASDAVAFASSENPEAVDFWTVLD